jgi:integrase
METLGVEYRADTTASDLAQNRGGLVLMREGASLVAIQRILGHNSMNITQRYLGHLSRADLAQWGFSPE